MGPETDTTDADALMYAWSGLAGGPTTEGGPTMGLPAVSAHAVTDLLAPPRTTRGRLTPRHPSPQPR